MKKVMIALFVIFIAFMSTSSVEPAQSEWGPWTTTACLKGLDFSVRRGAYNDQARKYEWFVRFRNRYQSDVSFDFVLKESGVYSANTTDRTTVRANSDGGQNWFLVPDANRVNLFVDKVRFGNDDWGSPYSPCDNQ